MDLETWIRRTRDPRAVPYFVFRGETIGGQSVAWGTRSVRHQDGLIEGRLSLPQSVVRGLPEAYGAPPERVAVSLTLDNTDGALTWLLTGGPSPQLEFQGGDSALALRGKLYAGFLWSTGVLEERAVTPTLCLAGHAAQERRVITLPMGSMDERQLGAARDVITVADLRRARFLDAGDYVAHGYVGPFDNLLWHELREYIEPRDDVIPFAYGVTPVPLIPMAGWKPGTPLGFAAWLQTRRPDISGWTQWRRFGPTIEDEPPWQIGGSRSFSAAFSVQLRFDIRPPDAGDIPEGLNPAPVAPDRIRDLWLVGLWVYTFLESDRSKLLESTVHLVPEPENRVGMPPGREPTTPGILRQLITDHTELGEAAIDEASFAAAQAGDSSAGTVGGLYAGDSAVWEVAQHLSSLGYALYVGADDKVRCLQDETWSWAQQEAGRLAVPHIRLADIARDQWREWLPEGGSGARGGAAVRLSIDWSASQASIWPESMLRVRMSPPQKVQVVSSPESRVSGAWVYPPMARHALLSAGVGRTFPRRRLQITTDLWAAALELGDLVRVSHPDGAQSEGYRHRLCRVERLELLPSQMAITMQLEDLGSVEHLRLGVLDSIEHWIRYKPSDDLPVSITIDAYAQTAMTSKPVFDQTMIGCSLRTWGAQDVRLRRSWRITGYLSPTEVTIGGWKAPSALTETIEGDNAPTYLQSWMIVGNRTSEGPDFRPQAICLSSEETGLFTDGATGYVLT